MTQKHTITFRIVGFTPATLPMARLADYLKELASLYGNQDQVHFERVSKGSAALKLFFNTPAAKEAAQQKCAAVAQGIGSTGDLKTFNRINDLLREDNTYAESIDASVETCRIVEFPGVKKEKPVDFDPLKQAGSIQGEIILIGGKDSTIPLWLRERSGQVLKNINLSKPMAKELAPLLFTSVRLHGMGKWVRTADHEWKMVSFDVQSHEQLSDDSLHDVINKLRAVPGNGWNSVENPYDYLQKLRD